MPEPVVIVLRSDARSVGEARRRVRDVVQDAGGHEHLDAVVLALSEVVTNAFVHAGTDVTVLVWATADGTRVEVEDGATRLPARRHYAEAATTGRGLQLVDEVTRRWGAHRRGAGKVVWFEVGDVPGWEADADAPSGAGHAPPAAVHTVTLVAVPLLMHWAWQEHAAALLREYLLYVLDDDVTILDRHAEASKALSLLRDQVPAPVLSDDRDVLMVDAMEPSVTSEAVVLQVPAGSLSDFVTLDDLLRRALDAARAGHLLGPPTQPEIEEMRLWLCGEIARQAGGDPTSVAWVARTDTRETVADQALLTATYAALAATEESLLATDEASVIVAVSPSALRVLGYAHRDELLGRRVIAVIPGRYHQAHIAGITLNATNGRDTLLGVPLAVPMVHRDGAEVLVSLEVRPERLDRDHRVFVARFRPTAARS
ncbi:ATP-binding protein [Nocardioides rubriscoriae]|uniref:ATP-binding protein n=1 Tax=Nocardioides rubriscoriae TaxID=642762 RepID=UPI0011DF26F0|nr:ATP-binding protein [Nocardioides rubriscoriae]